MGKHLDDNDLNGYIHQTLTDAQRESMDRHLADCPLCRARVDDARRLQRQIRLELDATLRQAQPARTRQFSQMRASLPQQRQRALWRFHSLRMLSGVGTLGAVVLLCLFAVYVLQFWPPTPTTQLETAAPSFFAVNWDDTTPFAQGLVAGEQSILARLPQATVYHVDVHIRDDLRRVNGRQQIRYVNNTGQALDDVALRLLANLGDSQLTVANVLVNGRIAPPTVVNTSTISVKLPETLAPGAAVVLEMDFSLLVGRSRRTFDGALGLLNDVLGLAYWHPTVAAFADGDWLLDEPVHGLASMGDKSYFLVRVTASSEQVLITSGVEVDRKPTIVGDDAQQEVTFAAGPVDLFYLTASERYQVVLSQTVGNTRINSYAYADYLLPDAQQALTEAAALLETYDARFGVFPFTELDLVGTPNLSFSRAGVSYPGVSLLSLNSYLYGKTGVDVAAGRQVTAQWFGRIVGQQVLAEPWLALSLTEYVALGEESGDAITMNVAAEKAPALPIGLPAAAYESGEFDYVMRERGTQFLGELETQLGADAFAALLRAYYQEFAWGGATAVAFQQLAEAQCACDLTPLFQEWVYGAASGD
ncbi:MAG: hypothetical protein R3E31_10645 [Chloroflexota bacterium]